MRKCGHCGKSIAGKRSDAKWCSTSCRVMASRARKRFPAEMTSADRWVRYKLAPRKNGKLAKVPIQLDGRNASSTDSATWTSFKAAQASSVGDGLGWVLGNGIGCLDLDDCFDDAGRLSGFAQSVLDQHRAEAILVEKSQSGKGLHIFLPMPQGAGSRREGIEVYPPDSGRFIAVTGDRI